MLHEPNKKGKYVISSKVFIIFLLMAACSTIITTKITDYKLFLISDKLPEALATRCAKCTDKQKQIGKQLAKEVKAKRPDLWNDLVAYYDPQGKYQEAFEDYLKP